MPSLAQAAVCFALLCAGASRLEAASPYTLNFPCEPNLATPAWLGHPVMPVGTFASVDLPLLSAPAGESLLVTIFFEEKDGGFMRLTWKDNSGETELSQNFYEGVGMKTQRSILLPASQIANGGTLRLQTGDATWNVQKIHFAWLEEHPALVPPDQSAEEVMTAPDQAVSATALDGQPAGNDSAILEQDLVTVPILTGAQRIETGVEFSLQLDGVPRAARLSFQEMGLPWGTHLVLWVNQKRAGIITPSVPDLADEGFSVPSGPAPAYVGWRTASVYLPVALLKAGMNPLQVSVENDDPTQTDSAADEIASGQPLAIKKLVCQFDFSGTAAPVDTSPGLSLKADPGIPVLAPLPPISTP